MRLLDLEFAESASVRDAVFASRDECNSKHECNVESGSAHSADKWYKQCAARNEWPTGIPFWAAGTALAQDKVVEIAAASDGR
jgi:hypothetical protein